MSAADDRGVSLQEVAALLDDALGYLRPDHSIHLGWEREDGTADQAAPGTHGPHSILWVLLRARSGVADALARSGERYGPWTPARQPAPPPPS